MPKGEDWIYFIYVNLGFIMLILTMASFGGMSQVMQNWPVNRCNPIYMPFADNIEENFIYCIQNMQTGFMGYLLQPIYYILNVFSSMGGEFSEALNDARTMMSTIRSFITNTIQSVFGVFLNLIIEFQKITISIKDLVGKIIGIMVTLMYIVDGSMQTMQSAWNGPPGQMVQALCFHPNTRVKIKLLNGKIKNVKMKNLNLGDILINGSKVTGIIKLANIDNEPLYKISNIYVTGTHMILSNKENKFIQVKNHEDAILQTDITSEWFSCLITDDHKIIIDDYIFWDWEDDELKK